MFIYEILLKPRFSPVGRSRANCSNTPAKQARPIKAGASAGIVKIFTRGGAMCRELSEGSGV